MSIARRVADHFVAPAGRRPPHHGQTCADGRRRRADTAPTGASPAGACAVTPPRTPVSVALLAAAGDAPALAAGLALALARRERAPVAVVCVWAGAAGPAPWRAPATPAAARLASAMAARGHGARASGRLVIVRLAARSAAAAAEARRVIAAAGSVPTVLALAGPRAAAFDALLDEQDLVVAAVAAGADPALARLAVAGLRRGVACEVAPAHPARTLAAAGVALLPSARRALAAPVEALP